MQQFLIKMMAVMLICGMIHEVQAELLPTPSSPVKDPDVVDFPKNPPQKKDLFEFVPSSNSKTLKFFIDTKNITWQNEFIRYVVVIQNPEGIEQTLYNGIDCDKSLKYFYGTLQADGTWKPSVNQTWQPIGPLGYNNYARYLQIQALCFGDIANDNLERINRLLREAYIFKP
jgi:hypothetical protein